MGPAIGGTPMMGAAPPMATGGWMPTAAAPVTATPAMAAMNPFGAPTVGAPVQQAINPMMMMQMQANPTGLPSQPSRPTANPFDLL